VAPPPAASGSLLSSTIGLVGSTVGSTVGLVGSVAQQLLSVPVVTRTVPLLRDETVTQVIGPNGGTIVLPGSKTTITFAPGAVDKPTAISATAYAGLFMAYGFAPHGITFKAPVTFKADLTFTTAFLHPEWASTMAGDYAPNGLSDIDASGNATVTEQNPAQAEVSGGKVLSATFNIPHFSGYILASGRSSGKSTMK
jgi:hypothetical protein